jgi:hypothetical protein
MSDEQLYGIAEREHSAGYSPMPLANPLPREEFDNTSAPAPDDPYRQISPNEAAEALVQQRSHPVEEIREPTVTETPPTPVEYRQQLGENAGQRMPEHQTVSPEQAAHDLSSWRETVGQSLQDAQDAELQSVIDQLRAGDQQPQQPVAEPQQQQAAQQAEIPPNASSPPDDEVAQALRNPKVLAALEQQVSQYQTAAETARQQYEAGLIENTRMALAGLVSGFPELSGVPASGLAIAIQTIQKTAPERAAAISKYLDSVSGLLQNTNQVLERQQAEAAQTQQKQIQQYTAEYARQFQAGARDADANFDDWRRSENISDSQLESIRKESLAMLEDYGLTKEQIAREWSTSSLFRSFPSQRLMADAARYRLSVKGLRKAVARPVPPVQRPGSPSDRASEGDYELTALSQKLDKSAHWKDAAALLHARRARR